MDYIAQPKDYWIAQQAIDITLNALDNPNRINGTLLTGAAILCYIDGVEGLDYDAGHHFKTWPLAFSPTRFNNNNVKYVYVAIPRTEQIGTQAVVVFPEEQLDVYGMNASDEQVGSADYYYIWLQGVISDTDGITPRAWSQQVDFGKKGTDEDLYDFSETDWYIYSKVTNSVTFLKKIVMQAGSYFQNIFLGSRELTGVATGATTAEYVDSEVLVATPSYIKANYLSKKSEDQAQEQIGFLKGLWVKAQNLFGIDANGNAKVNELEAADSALFRSLVSILGLLEAKLGIKTTDIVSDDYTGDDAFDKGWGIFKHKDASHPHSYAVIDELFVRIKAVFNELEVRKMSFTGGDQVASHAGGKVVMVRTLYAPTDGVLSLDNATYDESRQMLILHGAIYSAEDERIILQQDEVDTEGWIPVAYRCYFTKDDGTMATRNWWKEDDQARWQTVGIQDAGVYHDYETRAGWRLVTEVGSELVTIGDGDDATEVMYDYIDLSIEEQAGTGTPQAGDYLVQMGNRTDTERQDFILWDITSLDSPSLKMYEGVHDYTLPEPTQQISRRDTHMAFNKLFIKTDYGTFQQPCERGNWSDIPLDEDNHRRCYYYDLLQHNGGTWLCITAEQIGYTTDEPSSNSPNWRVYAAKGENGAKGDTPMQAYQWNSSASTAPSPLPSGATLGDWSATAPVRPSTAGEHYLWMTQTVKHTAADGTVTYDTWSAATRVSGDDGANGEDGVTVSATPPALLVNQDINNPTNLSSLSERVTFLVLKGTTPLTVTKVDGITVERDTGLRAKCTATGSNSNYATLTAMNTDTSGNYYDRASFTCSVHYTDNGVAKQIDNVRVNIACQLVGTWKETIEGDVKEALAESSLFEIDPQTGDIKETHNWGEFYQSSEANISKLTSQMNNGKNLLSGVLTGDGWRSAANIISSSLHNIQVDADGFFCAYTNDTVILKTATIVPVTDYCVSFKTKTDAVSQNIAWIVRNYLINDPNAVSGTIAPNGTTSRQFTFRYAGTGSVRIIIGVSALKEPQLELGTVATTFSAPTSETTSQMKQTSSEISASVKNDYQQAGLKITAGGIQLMGGLVDFTSANGTPYIKVKVDGNGMPHFIFLAPDGVTEMYDLGYSGLRQLVNNSVPDEYVGGNMLSGFLSAGVISPWEDGDAINPATLLGKEDQAGDHLGDIPVWLFNEGYTVAANHQRIYNWSSTSEPSNFDGAYLLDDTVTLQAPGTLPDDGWYFTRIHYEGDGEYSISLIYVEDGHATTTIPLRVWSRTKDPNASLRYWNDGYWPGHSSNLYFRVWKSGYAETAGCFGYANANGQIITDVQLLIPNS